MYIREVAQSSSSKKLSSVALGLIIAGCSIFGIAVLAAIIMCCKRPDLMLELDYGWHGITFAKPTRTSAVGVPNMKPSSKGVVRGPKEPPPVYTGSQAV